jgi:hypothetical protein
VGKKQEEVPVLLTDDFNTQCSDGVEPVAMDKGGSQ